MHIVSRTEINLRVYERGVGETLACGTGACAAVVAGRLQKALDATVKVNLPGGQLSIHWPGEERPVIKTGPATSVFHGQVNHKSQINPKNELRAADSVLTKYVSTYKIFG